MTTYANVKQDGSFDTFTEEAKAGWVVMPDDADFSWTYVDGVWAQDANKLAEIEAGKPFEPLPRVAFLFMAAEIGLTETLINTLIATMPSSTPEETQGKRLAAIVFANVQTFHRDNDLLAAIIAMTAGEDYAVTAADIDTAWRIGETLTWQLQVMQE